MRFLNTFTIATLTSMALAPIYTKLAIAQDALNPHEGAYVGIVAGVAGKGTTIDRSPTAAGDFSMDKNSGTVGVVGGYNWIFRDRFMLGLESDFSYMGSSFSKTDATLGAVKLKGRFVGSLRGRAGIAWDSSLFYATAGLAFSDISANPVGVSAKKELRAGFVGGLGYEFAMNNDWSARVEGLFYAFGENDTVFAGSKRDSGMGFATIRLGLTKKF